MDIWLYLILTLAIELSVIVFWLQKEWEKAVFIGLLLNLFTWSLLVTLAGLHWNIPVMELGVVLVEGLGYRLFFRRSWKSCLSMSLLANGLSYLIGLLIYYGSQ